MERLHVACSMLESRLGVCLLVGAVENTCSSPSKLSEGCLRVKHVVLALHRQNRFDLSLAAADIMRPLYASASPRGGRDEESSR